MSIVKQQTPGALSSVTHVKMYKIGVLRCLQYGRAAYVVYLAFPFPCNRESWLWWLDAYFLCEMTKDRVCAILLPHPVSNTVPGTELTHLWETAWMDGEQCMWIPLLRAQHHTACWFKWSQAQQLETCHNDYRYASALSPILYVVSTC